MDAPVSSDPFARLLQNSLFRSAVLISAAVLVVTLAFPGLVRGLFRSDQFMPHANCYLRNSSVIGLNVTGDLIIGASYVAISSMLAYLVFKASKDIPFHWMFLAFGLFIVTCGLTHFMEVWTVWTPLYWLAGYLKLICAAASAVTAVALYRHIPRVFSLISSVRLSEERRRQLETANRELEAFAYSVSHDLRAPLRTVQGMAGILKEDYGQELAGPVQAHLDRILQASQRMDLLIQDLLEYSRVSRAQIKIEPVELAAVIEGARRALAADAEQKGAEILLPSSLPRVMANQTLLTQVMQNLLSNALKFVAVGEQPKVEIATRQVIGGVRILVKDNGIGISQEHRQKIFKIFERLHSSADYPGTGIGLAIVEKAMTRMGGHLGFDSTPGQGSTFWIELPAAPPKEVQALAA